MWLIPVEPSRRQDRRHVHSRRRFDDGAGIDAWRGNTSSLREGTPGAVLPPRTGAGCRQPRGRLYSGFRLQLVNRMPKLGGSGNCGNLATPGIEVRHAAGKRVAGIAKIAEIGQGAGQERASAVMNTSNAPLMSPSSRQLETNDFWRKSSRRPAPLSKSMEIPFAPRLIPSESTPHRSDCHSRRAAI